MLKFLSNVKSKIDDYSRKRPAYFLLIILIIPVILLLFEKTLSLNTVNLHDKDVTVSFSPEKLSPGRENEVKIIINAKKHAVAFTRIAFIFDPQLIQITAEPAINPNLSTIIEKTHLLEANNTGKYVIVAAASPLDHPPTNTFEFATFRLNYLDANPGILKFDRKNIQVVSKKVKDLSINFVDVKVQ